MRSKIPKFIVAILLMVLSFSLSGCRLIDKLDTLSFNPMLNYLNLNYVDIYYQNDIADLSNKNQLVYFDFKEHDKSYYKKQEFENSNEFESQFSKYGIVFSDDVYMKRYFMRNEISKDNDRYFYIDISIKNFKAKNLTLECEGYENMIVSFTDNSLELYTKKNSVDKWKIDNGKKIKNILLKCKFYDGTSKAPRIEHLEEK